MDLNEAKKILELPNDYTPEMIKQNYRRLSLKFHPDKGGKQEDFVKITEAYRQLNGNEPESLNNTINLNDIFRTFIHNPAGNFFKSKIDSFFGFKKEVEIILTPREFLEGVTKEIETTFKSRCTCEQQFCQKCRGFSFRSCEECLGNGYTQQCHLCTNGVITHIKKFKLTVPKNNLSKLYIDNCIINLKVVDERYFVKENSLYYYYDISLKESLTGFVKTFKDPFGIEHPIKSNSIIKQNDGYHVTDHIFLIFNIIYPKKLLKQLKHIDF